MSILKKSVLSFKKLILGLLLFSIPGCSTNYSSQHKITGYDLTQPSSSNFLPEVLREISGITYLDSTTVACVQDENGFLFIYDLDQNEIKKQIKFGDSGDYEGIARVNHSIYVLRSDGTLFEILKYDSPEVEVTVYKSEFFAPDNEGLCYDLENNRLLIACKGAFGEKNNSDNKRLIYGFDLTTKKFTQEPVFTFDMNVIRQFAERKKVKLNLQSDSKQNEGTRKSISLNISAIGIQPLTKKLFVISAEDYLLFIFDRKGNLEHMEALNPEIFNKAEGITFLENNDLLISNEGQNDAASIVRFNLRKEESRETKLDPIKEHIPQNGNVT